MPRYLKHIYCECKFLEICISKTENWSFDKSSFEELRLWMCVKKMLFSSDIVLHLDMGVDELNSIKAKPKKELNSLEKALQQLASQQQMGLTNLKLTDRFVMPVSIDFSDNTQLTAYYLTCTESSQKYMNDYGIMVITPEYIKDFTYVMYDNGRAIRKGERKSWKDLLMKHPCNSLALADNYICTDDATIRENLIDIFDAILPLKLDSDLNVPFQISIFTTLKTNDNRDDINSKKCLRTIAEFIEKIRPNLYFKLSIFKCKQFHDRIIATNNTFINCPGGFDLMKYGKSSKTTMINIINPYINNSTKWNTDAYSNFLNEITKVHDNSTEFQSDDLSGFYVGDKRNRLFI